MIELKLPWPPSVNRYYRFVPGHKPLISREGRAYRKRVQALLAGGTRPLDCSLAFVLDAYPPDRRRRDLDNLLKCLQDSLEHAGVYEDDGQIDQLIVNRKGPVIDGMAVVRIAPLPVAHCIACGHELEANG